MKNRNNRYWIIVDKEGEVYPLSIKTTKKDCIGSFPVHMLPGFKCVLVSVEFTEIKKIKI